MRQIGEDVGRDRVGLKVIIGRWRSGTMNMDSHTDHSYKCAENLALM